jgi:hypothetical protein
MFRTALIAVVGLVLATQVTAAQGAPPDNEDGRYTFNRADDGYLRLDGRTGQVSICTRRSVGWACQAVPDERTALEGEIARLQGENATLKKELIAHNVPLPGTVKPDAVKPDSAKPDQPASKPGEPQIQLPSDAELNKLMTFMEKVWRRLVEMVVTLQKEMSKG